MSVYVYLPHISLCTKICSPLKVKRDKTARPIDGRLFKEYLVGDGELGVVLCYLGDVLISWKWY